MSETWQVFQVAELDSISIECPNCRTVSTFPASGDPAGQTNRQCPGCNKPIPRAGEILNLYRAFHRSAIAAVEHERVAVTLRGRERREA